MGEKGTMMNRVEVVADDAYLLIQEGKVKEAFQICRRYIEEHDESQCAIMYSMLGQGYIVLSDYPQAIQNIHKGIRIANEIEDKIALGKLFMLLSIVYMYMEDVEEGLKIQLEALKIAKDQKSEELLAVCYNNLGGIYCSMKRYDEALISLQKVINYPIRKDKQRMNYAICAANNNIAEAYFYKKSYQDAIAHYEKTLELANRINAPRYIGTVNFNLAELYKEIGEYNKSLYHAEEALEKTIAFEDKQKESESYKQISEIYESMEDYRNALIFFKCYKDTKEMILNTETSRKVKELEREHDEKERQRELEQAMRLRQINEELTVTNQKLVKANEEIKYLSMRDFLTDTFNRRGFEMHISEIKKACKENQKTYSIMMIDIDNFKKINDTYGHDVGDQILKHCAQLLKDVVGDRGIVGRFGGEEFIVASKCCIGTNAVVLAEAIRKSIEQTSYSQENEGEITYTVTIGVSMRQTLDEKIHLREADQCLYKGKQSTKNCVIHH